MFLIKNFKKLIPSYRHKTNIYLWNYKYHFIKNFNNKLKFLFTRNLLKRRKKFYTKKLNQININYNMRYTTICSNIIFNNKPYKRFAILKNLFNHVYTIPGLENIKVGDIFIHRKYWFLDKTKNIFFFGMSCLLKEIPFNFIISNITNFLIQKITFTKSSGTFSKKQKTKKTKKLIQIILPSQQLIFLPQNSTAFIGKNYNFNSNKLVEGKWGFSFHKNKKINVRGVAMNPVDHPNGGRTKTVQPERSPWNWVAKLRK